MNCPYSELEFRPALHEEAYTQPADWWKAPESPYVVRQRPYKAFKQARPKVIVYFIKAASTDQRKAFDELVKQWEHDTHYSSSVLEMVIHPCYQQIIGMGRAAIPFILQDLKAKPNHWFWALRAISGENPVPPDAKGNICKMAEAWLSWGARAGYEF